MKLTFWGAAEQVTGSLFQLELEDGYSVLIDCGMDMERWREHAPPPLYPGANFPFDASTVDAVLLTHAHLDHSGRIPNLLKDGFEGQVLCTTPTMQLSSIILHDSARINQMKLRKYHRKKSKNPGYKPEAERGEHPGEWYTETDVNRAMERFVPIASDRPFRLTDSLTATFLTAGHLLGASSILLEVREGGETKTILFSGDIGRHNYPLLPDPAPLPPADYVICETTYGNRHHQSEGPAEEELADLIKKTCVDVPGRLIIPAFSIGRTQALLYAMNKISKEHGLPPIKVFSDSPMAYASNRVYQTNVGKLNEEAQAFQQAHGELFDFNNLVYIEQNEASKALSNYREPCVIISSSGMMEGGRIQHHLQANLSNPYCTVYIIGYCADGTLGRKLLDGERTVKMGKQEIQVAARIAYTDAFSGHGDLDDLVHFVAQQPADRVKRIFLVHGERGAMGDFRETLAGHGYGQVEIPSPGQTYEL
jgi:metallo-beta-lactamase family protein